MNDIYMFYNLIVGWKQTVLEQVSSAQKVIIFQSVLAKKKNKTKKPKQNKQKKERNKENYFLLLFFLALIQVRAEQ